VDREASPPFARPGLIATVGLFVVMACVFGSTALDIDEFRVIKEPYEMVGGDYTVGYLKAHEAGHALGTAGRAYYFYWKYRPLSAPIIDASDRSLFRAEEERFGYHRPEPTGVQRLEVYRDRLIVPEPERFRHGAGAPLFSAVLRIPSLALTRAASTLGLDLLDYQFSRRYNLLFLVPRLQGLLAGIACVLLVYLILLREKSAAAALPGAMVMAFAPPALMFFPNLHYDALLAPFVLGAAYLFTRDRAVPSGICFGLAMAVKNTAVFLFPAIVAFVVVETLRSGLLRGEPEAARTLWRRAAALGWFTLVGVLALTPFANPLSQLREVLTPIVSRPIDTRFEDPATYTLRGSPAKNPGPGQSDEPIELVLLKRALDYDLSLLVVLVGLPLLWLRLHTPFGRLAFWFLLMSFPYRVVFGDSLGYRSLMFLPFFAILAALALDRRVVLGIAGLWLAMDLVFLRDPVAAMGLPRAGATASTAPSSAR